MVVSGETPSVRACTQTLCCLTVFRGKQFVCEVGSGSIKAAELERKSKNTARILLTRQLEQGNCEIEVPSGVLAGPAHELGNRFRSVDVSLNWEIQVL